MRVLELYSGIGGMHYAFQESGAKGTIVASVDINPVSNEVYRFNFPHTLNLNRNIQSFDVKEIESMNIDCFLMSPPCQPFTRVGLKKDISDNRSSSFQHVLKLIPEIKSLKYILVENVKGFEKSQMRKQLISCIESSGFNYKEFILSPCQFGIPNTRHRYYMIAKRQNMKFCFDNSTLVESLPEKFIRLLPKSVHASLAVEDNFANPINGRKCYSLYRILENEPSTEHSLPLEVLEKRIQVLDIRTGNTNGSCCFTKAYGRYLEGTGSVYCPLSTEVITDKLACLETYKNDMKQSSKLLMELNLRYFTPTEVARLMCFPQEFHFPQHITVKQKYRLLGNSINVHVVSQLIFLLNYEASTT
ncbi:tRNA (cytosine(38)-C(5))-methyltransferase isoform X1 [Orussus abietinus]|uniref:tRNA (cytosine(38)-C(5))-methyltransferase isoform X1 n=1 Tax=Orussus abietinus TaxID=222816 RepID=UPI0006252DD3|nr:tRNA (cytosine(38)-C(5))-methyltransferase isoform X1 [Orussus abietinus]